MTFSVSSSIVSGFQHVRRTIRLTEKSSVQTRRATDASHSQTGGTSIPAPANSFLANNSSRTMEVVPFGAPDPERQMVIFALNAVDSNPGTGFDGEKPINDADVREYQDSMSNDKKVDEDTVKA